MKPTSTSLSIPEMDAAKDEHQEKSFEEVVITPPRKFDLEFHELIKYRGLLASYVWRDINVKYKQTVLGFLWVILQPLTMMTIFVVFFSRFLNVPTDNVPAPIFYYSGLIIWSLFASSLTNASNSMLSNAELIKKVYFPRLIIPISSVAVALFDYAITMGLFILMIIFYKFTNDSFQFSALQFVLCIPIAVLMASITAFGAGAMIAALNLKYRDFRFIVPFMVQFLMFVTPVIYPVSVLNNHIWLKYLFAINPMFSVLNISRLPFTSVELDIYMITISLISMLVLFFGGVYTFKKTERFFADIA